jgi:hypothetical protein
MSVPDLGLVYLGVGCVCAVVVHRHLTDRRARGNGAARAKLWSAAACIPLWPLWVPFALSERDGSASGLALEPVSRIEEALRKAMAAAAGTPFEALWPPATRAALMEELRRVGERLSDLERCIAAHDLKSTRNELPLSDVAAERAAGRILTTVQLRRQAERQLIELHNRHLRALAELAELVELLHAQLLVARYAGASTEHVDELVAEVRLRLEAMSCVHFGAPERAPAA